MEQIKNIDFATELKKNYLIYAEDVISNRAIPDARDGLKPVQRRILYSMYKDKVSSTGNYIKNAKVIGSCMGTFHPHGDCLRGDTKVFLANGSFKTIKELYEEGKEQDILCVDDNGHAKIATAHSFRIGQNTNRVYNIELSNGEIVSVTENHPFLTTDMKWIKASELNKNQRLLSAILNFDEDKKIRPSVSINGKMPTMLHKIIETGCQINHHIDFNINNNSRSNIQGMSRGEHAFLHKDYIVGLNNGRKSMFNELNSTITREKNKKLRLAYNKNKPLYTAYKVLQFLIDKKIELNEENYNNFRTKCNVYNATKLDVLFKKQYSKNFADLLEKFVSGFSPIRNEKISCKEKYIKNNTKSIKEKDVVSFVEKSIENRAFFVIDYLIDNRELITLSNYEKTRRELLNNEKQMKNLTKITNEKHLNDMFVKYKNERIYVSNIEIEEVDKESMYDFTVDCYENMFIPVGKLTNNKYNLICVHNSSLADALNRLAQDFCLPIPFIDGHGNYGTIDGDPAASYRYILCKLSKFAEDVFFKDIDYNTVDWIDNYEGTTLEPTVLPARFPTILLTGQSGLAVGMATNFYTYNFKEVCDAIVDLVDDANSDIFKHILGPDFPLGGIVNTSNFKAFSENTVALRFRNEIELEEEKKNKCLIMKSICYGVNKTKLISEIATKVNDGKIVGISNIRDESNKEGIRIVFDIIDGFDPKAVAKSIYDNTSSECNLNNNMNVISQRRPQKRSIRELLVEFIEFRKNVIIKRTTYKKNEIKNKIEILEGILLALKHSDEVIKIVKTSESPLKKLQTQIGFTERQAEYVYNMPIRRFGTLEVAQIKNDHAQQLSDLQECENILSTPKMIEKIIIDETEELKKKYGYERKTKIVNDFILDLKPTVKEQKIFIQILIDGTIKAVPSEMKNKYINDNEIIIDANYPKFQMEVNSYESVALFTNKGNRYQLEIKKLPLMNMGKSPKKAQEYCAITTDEKIVAVTEWEVSDDKNIFCLGKNGLVKKQDNETIRKSRDNNYVIYDVERGGELIDAVVVGSNDDLSVCTKNGLILKKNMESIRPVGSRNSAGVNFIDISENDSIIGFVKNYENIVLVTKKGVVKKIDSSEIMAKNSGKQGMIAIKLDEKDEVIYAGNDKFGIVLSNKTIRSKIEVELSTRATKGKQIEKEVIGIVKG